MFKGGAVNQAGELVPHGVFEIPAPSPAEISGVAAVPGGYAVVGDEEPDCGRIWPGGTRFALPSGLKGPESIDVGMNGKGEQLWLILGEQKSRLVDLDGGSHTFDDDDLKEIAGRGLEGVTVRWHNDAWQVAVLWEGGYYDRDKDKDSKKENKFAKPRVVTFEWRRGKGVVGKISKPIKLDVPEPDNLGKSDTKKQRFRAPDLVWDDDGLLVLLASTDAKRKLKNRKHTWLQRFDLQGKAVGKPFKLEEEWGDYRDGKNWEGLDRTLDGRWLVLGHDAKRGLGSALSVFPVPIGA